MKIKPFVWLVLVMFLVVILSGMLPSTRAASASLDQAALQKQVAPVAVDGQVRVWVEYRWGMRPFVERALQNAGAEFFYSFDDLDSFVVGLPADRLAEIETHPLVERVEQDVKRYADAQTVPYGVDLVQARDLWDVNRDGVVDPGSPTGAGRTVCVIDSGLFTGHEDFQGVNVIGGYPVGWDTDTCGHGTHVAGTIAAMNNSLGVVGVTPGTTSLYIVKVFGDNCAWTYSSTLVDATNRCQAAGANIISMSLGGAAPNSAENTAFQNLYNAGILSIAASGNTGANEMHFPASYSSVVGVGAVDENMQIADFSTFNTDVELTAPGVGVLSTVPYLADAYLQVDGVKYDANHVEFAPYGEAERRAGEWRHLRQHQRRLER